MYDSSYIIILIFHLMPYNPSADNALLGSLNKQRFQLY